MIISTVQTDQSIVAWIASKEVALHTGTSTYCFYSLGTTEPNRKDSQASFECQVSYRLWEFAGLNNADAYVLCRNKTVTRTKGCSFSSCRCPNLDIDRRSWLWKNSYYGNNSKTMECNGKECQTRCPHRYTRPKIAHWLDLTSSYILIKVIEIVKIWESWWAVGASTSLENSAAVTL